MRIRWYAAGALVVLAGCAREVMRQDGARLLIEGDRKESLQNPAFSPHGGTVVFTRFAGGYNRGPSRIDAMPASGGEPIQLTPDVEADNDFMDVNLPGSCWNAAADRITFASDREDADEIWTMSADGTDLRRVTHHTNPPYYLEPSFSPDGQWIVFEVDYPDPRWEGGQRGEIWKVHSDGSELAKLIGADSTDDRQPNWSPAGDRILFQRRTLGDQEDWDVYTITPEGDSLFNVTNSGYSDTDASFSPDGSEIVYSSDHGGLECPNIFIISANGGTPTRITYADESEDGAPSFSPDGKSVAFESHEGADEEKPACIRLISLDR